MAAIDLSSLSLSAHLHHHVLKDVNVVDDCG
jgi:hypothetical protein